MLISSSLYKERTFTFSGVTLVTYSCRLNRRLSHLKNPNTFKSKTIKCVNVVLKEKKGIPKQMSRLSHTGCDSEGVWRHCTQISLKFS